MHTPREGRQARGVEAVDVPDGAVDDQADAAQVALDAYLELLEPSGLPWSATVLGDDVVACGLVERAIERGGHLRVGLEDWAGSGEPTNVDLLRAAVDLIERLGSTPATVPQARTFLGIPDQLS